MRDRDLPDPIEWDDLADHPDEVAAVVRRRVVEERLPAPPVPFPLPKGPGKPPRQLLHLDPVDDLLLRALTGRAVAKQRRLYSSTVVLNGAIEGRGVRWRSVDPKKAHAKRRTRANELVRGVGMGATDVSNYYPSVDTRLLEEQLRIGGVPSGTAAGIVHLLERSAELSGIPGLPLGPEASVFLGSVYLAPADGAFTASGVPHLRWTDDVWAFASDEAQWLQTLREFSSKLAALDLQPNAAKTLWYDADDARDVINNPVVASMLADAGPHRVSAAAAVERLVHMGWADAIGIPDAVDVAVLNFCLGSLRAPLSADGLPVLLTYPSLFDRSPVAVGRYLMEVARNQATKRKLDVDWLTGIASRPWNDLNRAASLHAMRVLAELAPSKDVGDVMLSIACGSRTDVCPVLQQWAARAWGRSSGAKLSVAVDAAEADPSLLVKRAFTARLRGAADSRVGRIALAHLRTLVPDLAPTVAWAAAG